MFISLWKGSSHFEVELKMTTASQPVAYRISSDAYELIERLKARLARLRQERSPLYLISEESDEICAGNTELQVGILCVLREVSVSIASAVLAPVFLGRYAIIDFRVRQQMFGEEKTTFAIADYQRCFI